MDSISVAGKIGVSLYDIGLEGLGRVYLIGLFLRMLKLFYGHLDGVVIRNN